VASQEILKQLVATGSSRLCNTEVGMGMDNGMEGYESQIACGLYRRVELGAWNAAEEDLGPGVGRTEVRRARPV
jgi:hypothetical protein